MLFWGIFYIIRDFAICLGVFSLCMVLSQRIYIERCSISLVRLLHNALSLGFVLIILSVLQWSSRVDLPILRRDILNYVIVSTYASCLGCAFVESNLLYMVVLLLT